MHLGKELLRTACAGLAVHLIVVSACSAGSGADGDPEFRLTDGTDAERAAAQNRGDSTRPARATAADAGQPSLLLPVAEAKANESGSRLKGRWYVGDDGSRQFLGWFDSELGTECGFNTGRDGVLRCLPSGGGSTVTATQFADADCSQPLFSLPMSACSGTAPAVGILQHTEGAHACSALKYRYFAIGSQVVPQAVYALSGSSASDCVPAAVNSALTYWAAGAELPLSSFVGGQLVTD